jgi:hypothetical protein
MQEEGGIFRDDAKQKQTQIQTRQFVAAGASSFFELARTKYYEPILIHSSKINSVLARPIVWKYRRDCESIDSLVQIKLRLAQRLGVKQ